MERFTSGLKPAYQRDHATVVVRVHFAVEQINSVYLHGVDNRVNSGCRSLRKEFGTHSTSVDIGEKNSWPGVSEASEVPMLTP
jgi:hypothetical protein